MERISVDPLAPDPRAIARAAEVIRGGGLVAFPTETVYGLGGDAMNSRAVDRIFRAKARPATNPLIVHLPDAAAVRSVVSAWPPAAERLARAFWPGPLTLVLPRRQGVPPSVSGGLPTVAVRVPAHPVALALLRSAGTPIAAPSANPAGRVSPTSPDHVARALGGQVDLLLDGGATPLGIESTVVDLTGDRPTLLRPGALAAAEIEEVAGTLVRAAATASPGVPLPSPGMLERHYAPRARVLLLAPGSRGRVDAALAAREEVARGGVIGALLMSPFPELRARHALPLPRDPREYARLLYGALHSLDDLGCTLIVVEPVPEDPEWEAVRDRLSRASRREP